ncbi:MAG: hypothetical protein ACPGVT_11005 [Maricaulaceae bacterium]
MTDHANIAPDEIHRYGKIDGRYPISIFHAERDATVYWVMGPDLKRPVRALYCDFICAWVKYRTVKQELIKPTVFWPDEVL